MTRIFLDANVLFSAALSDTGVARALVRQAAFHESTIAFLATGYVLHEAARNIRLKAPAAAPTLQEITRFVTLTPEPPEQLLEEITPMVPHRADVPVLAGAIYAGADILVTGNVRHFRELYGTRVGGVMVLSVRSALEILASDS